MKAEIPDDDKYSSGENLAQIYKSELSRSLWGALIFGLVIVVLWSVATHFLPSGWWIVVINILGFLSATFMGWTFWKALKIFISSGLALLISGVLWILIIIGGRTLILSLLESWTGG